MRRSWHKLGGFRPAFLIPVVVFIVSCLLGYYLVNLSLNHSAVDIKASFEKEGRGVQAYAQEKSLEYLQAIYDTQVLFSITGSASRADFHKQNNTTALKQSYPGLSMVGYAPIVDASASSDFIMSVRSDKTISSTGYPEYKISPTKTSGQYLPIAYLEPYNKDMMGVDLQSISAIQASINNSLATGEPAMTHKVRLYADRDGFVMLSPVYLPGADISTEQARRAAVRGVVFAGFKSYDIFPVLLAKSSLDSRVGVEIFSGEGTDPVNLLYSTLDSCNNSCEADYKNPLTLFNLPISASGSDSINVLDIKWTVKLIASNAYVSSHLGKTPLLVLSVSILGVILLTFAAVIFSLRSFGRSASKDIQP